MKCSAQSERLTGARAGHQWHGCIDHAETSSPNRVTIASVGISLKPCNHPSYNVP